MQRLRGIDFLQLLAHYGVASLGAFIVGFLPEAMFGNLYKETNFASISPIISLVGLFLGYAGARRFGHRASAWVWALGLAWFSVGFMELYKGWGYEWSHQPRMQYVLLNLFGKTSQCSDSECLYALFFSTPLSSSVAYSLGAFFGLAAFDLRRTVPDA